MALTVLHRAAASCSSPNSELVFGVCKTFSNACSEHACVSLLRSSVTDTRVPVHSSQQVAVHFAQQTVRRTADSRSSSHRVIFLLPFWPEAGSGITIAIILLQLLETKNGYASRARACYVELSSLTINAVDSLIHYNLVPV